MVRTGVSILIMNITSKLQLEIIADQEKGVTITSPYKRSQIRVDADVFPTLQGTGMKFLIEDSRNQDKKGVHCN